MKRLIAFALLAFFLCISSCKKNADSKESIKSLITFDMSDDQLGLTDADALLGTLQNAFESKVDYIPIRFTRDAAVLNFEVFRTDPRSAYDYMDIVTQETPKKAAHDESPARFICGGVIRSGSEAQKPTPRHPGNLELIWISVGNNEIITSGRKSSPASKGETDVEFEKTLKLYSKAITEAGEKSTIVVDAAPDVSCKRLFTVLEIMKGAGIDLLLIEGKGQQAPLSDR